MRQVWIWGVALVLTLFTAITSWATQSRVVTASAGAPIPTAYSSSNSQSMIWNNGNPHGNLIIHNTTASAIACMEGEDSTAAPDQTQGQISEEIPIPATTQWLLQGFKPAKRLYCRSNSGSTITSGTINIVAW